MLLLTIKEQVNYFLKKMEETVGKKQLEISGGEPGPGRRGEGEATPAAEGAVSPCLGVQAGCRGRGVKGHQRPGDTGVPMT